MKDHRFLENVRVVDLSQYIPGPFATRQLSDLGADVIKVEPPQGDPMRFLMHSDTAEMSPIYQHINRGKRVCRLDLKSKAGKRILQALITDADIVLESFRPGVMARLGFDRNELDRLNPRLIYCALSGYGQTGPYAARAGHDINYNALSAQSIVSGSAQQPIIGYPPIADHAGAMQACVAMLGALYGRDSSPRSIHLDISITESILSWQYMPMLSDTEARAESILNGGAACYNFYQCADKQFISLGAIEAGFWENFCRAMQMPDWIARQTETMPQQDLIAEVAEKISAHPLEYWHQRLDTVDCCYAPLLPPSQLATNPLFQAHAAVTESGPGYPGRINDESVIVDEKVFEVEDPAALTWRSIGSTSSAD